MKIYIKLILILTIVFSCCSNAQVKNPQAEAVAKVINNDLNYRKRPLSEVLKQFPDMKMIMVIPDSPEVGDITFVIKFVSNEEYKRERSNGKNPTSITLYVKQNPIRQIPLQIGREDISMQGAIKKYGELIVMAVSN
ncbi:hypothetical protein BEI02_16605 [Elizabethkingia sp. HvH-WGS333]|uniref:hypothetical protein n=1 Tax=Elizabethkingia TaxID=308865 RepID=UPI0007418186|nr:MULTISPECIES: hypothetical protein [Elizabethkingia]KUG13959.1 hypothetical protein AMC91_01515 [Elizabethkingia miricola]MCL1658525.1 hypothetical protein [Elizabethkingia miricola]MCP1253800.1 hypothetical protein [Elizabethkingia sp. S0634]MDX8573759.1 hypothetical protein [Elizabethkingia sp. HX QKY]OIK45786.1 hypothetical protein BEI02_16605 [Elizabethkingia sp. HvH-WGS333]